MSSITQKVTNLTIRLASEFKNVYSEFGKLEDLRTDDKTSLVAAINEVKSNPIRGVINDYSKSTWSTYSSSRLDVLLAGKTYTPINDTTVSQLSVYSSKRVSELLEESRARSISDFSTGTDITWSSQKITNYVSQRVDQVLGGAGEAFDTLRELQVALGQDQNFATTILNRLDKVIRADVVQTLTEEEKLRARENLGGVGLGGGTGGSGVAEIRLDVDGSLYWQPTTIDQEIFLDEDGTPYWGATPGIVNDDPFFVTEFTLPDYLSEPGESRDVLDSRIVSQSRGVVRDELREWKSGVADSAYEPKGATESLEGELENVRQVLDGKSNTGHSHSAGEIGAVARSGQVVSLWAGTQAQYDAIASKDSTTVYIITG